jgi:phage shock protein C
MATSERRLRKSRTDRMIDGVCGGIATYFSLDATLVRLLWVLLALCGGSGVVLYIAAMIIMPKAEPTPVPEGTAERKHDQNTKFWGILLVAVGAFWLMGNLGFPFWHHWWWFPWRIGVPLLLVLAGVMFLFGGRDYLSKGSSIPKSQPAQAAGAQGPLREAAPGSRRLYRSRTEKKVLGVCGGIGAYVNIDPVIIRLLFVVAAFASVAFVVILYVVMGIVVPKEPEATVPVV